MSDMVVGLSNKIVLDYMVLENLNCEWDGQYLKFSHESYIDKPGLENILIQINSELESFNLMPYKDSFLIDNINKRKEIVEGILNKIR